jgi:hypothetical protein
MKISLKALHESGTALTSLAEQKPKTAKLAYKLSRVVSSARSESELLAKTQLDLLQKFGKLSEPEAGRWTVEPERRVEFDQQWADLLETEVEVWGDPIKIDTLDGELNLSIDDYARLQWLFNDD